jgi:hypothetical protein
MMCLARIATRRVEGPTAPAAARSLVIVIVIVAVHENDTVGVIASS